MSEQDKHLAPEIRAACVAVPLGIELVLLFSASNIEDEEATVVKTISTL